MEFSSAKGILVVDPIEARNICIKRASSNVYCLFQIDNRVYRSKTTAFKVPSLPRWKEDSQCRFDIDPGVTPLLKVFVLEKTNGLPLVVGKGELNLIDIFYEKKSDRWVKLSPMGQLDLELTFYQAAPMLPRKTLPNPKVPPKHPQREGEVKENLNQKVSSVDQVFEEENREERHRLRQLAKKVKRRYRESRSSREFVMKEQLKKMTNDELLYVEVNQKIEKALPDVPGDDSVKIEENIPDINVLSIDTESISQIDLNKLPFSADSIGTHMITKLDELKAQQEKQKEEDSKKMYTPLSTEAFSIISRLERGRARPKDLQVEGGASDYKGDGTWGKGRLTDAAYTGERPRLPPKIPYGMNAEEYYMLQRREYVDYFKTVV